MNSRFTRSGGFTDIESDRVVVFVFPRTAPLRPNTRIRRSTDGNGNPATGDFHLPDMRGRFPRGVDAGTGRDPDVADRVTIHGATQTGVGGVQEDAFQGHWHYLQVYGYTRTDVEIVNNTMPSSQGNFGITGWAGSGLRVHDPRPDEINGPPRTSSETRPKNVAVNYIIKY